MSTTHHPSTKEDIMRYLLRQGEATAQELAEALTISPQAVRRHLKDLETEQLLEHQTVQVGMGRPQHVYHLSKTGRSHFPEAYDQFALGLLDTLAANFPPEQVQEILRQQWQRKAAEYRSQLGTASVAERLNQLVALRRSEGYMTEWHPLSPEEAQQLELPIDRTCSHLYLLTEFHCAISSVAESFPNVCDYELELFNATLEDCQVQRIHWMMEGEHRCGYLVQAI
ncbi:MAG: iron-sulfur cluster biosynthesis transcriptional regulator SufR [Prochlorothrix sp.]|nr:iron-sulfur cluster biosynthesis transcriptional regulator SufR [Prochlorothrix sp.]